MKWSYSGLKKFTTCPRQFYAVRISKKYVEPPTQATLYGQDVHRALEELVSKNAALPQNYQKYKPFMDLIMEIPGIRYTEYKMALDENKKPCDFGDANYWVRGICDLLIVDSTQAYIVDYKTGSDRYADTNQLKLMAAMVFEHFQDLQEIKAGLLFVDRNVFVDEEYKRQDLGNLWGSFSSDLMRLQQSFDHNHWPENPSGLCKKHCVDVSCPHNGRV